MTALTATTPISLPRLAEMAGGDLRIPGGGSGPAVVVEGVSIDTRTLVPGEVFVPLPGRHADGHEFLGEAFGRGASAALCSRRWHESRSSPEPGPLIVVPDVTQALQRWAREHRRHWRGLLIGITGSSGKTTTKDLVAASFAAGQSTLKTEGNLNNHWGVPLTLLRLRPEHRVAVVEMGTNHPGEIALLAGIAAPESSIITNVGSAHLEHFGSVEAIAREKAALGFALGGDQTLFAGADSPALIRALEGAPCRIVTFGLARTADVRPAELQDLGPEGSRFRVEGFPPVRLALVGRHQVANALAALAVAREVGLDPEATVAALESHRAARGRMEVRVVKGASLVVDCYNANPESTHAALEALAAWPNARRRIAVLGDMLELGDRAAELHRRVGAAVRGAELWTVGERAEDYALGAREAGGQGRVFPDQPSLAAALRGALSPGTVVLLKASRGAALERVLEGLESEE